MKYILFGGSGFIGGRLAELLPENSDIVIFGKEEERPSHLAEHATYETVDFAEIVDFTPYICTADIVFHLVSTVFPTEGTENIIAETESDIFPTIRLLDAIAALPQMHRPKVIFISSGGTVYGEFVDAPLREKDSLNPICKYAIHKITIENYLHLYWLYHNIEYRVVRLSNPYGAYLRSGKGQGIIPILIDKMARHVPIEIWGDGQAMRDYIYIDDAIQAILSIASYKGPLQTFNVGSGICTSTLQLIDTIAKSLLCDYPELIFLPGRKCDVQKNMLDISQIEKCLGWKPAINLEDGIQMCIQQMLK